MMDSDEMYLCHKCGKVFYRLSTLESHSRWKHMEKSNDFMCEQCGRRFQKKYNLLKHLESGIHYVSETVKCALCEFRALNRKLMGEHYQNFHGVTLKESNVYFKTADEFYMWKNEFENRTRSRFVKMSSSRKRKNGFIRSTYFCHRDGNFIPKGRNIRHMKVKGSNKINAHCPAKMDVDIGERIVIVSYIDTHLGHELDITRMNLDHTDKALIAKKLALKVPFETILDDINNSVDNKQLKRVNLLTRKDLWNIVDTFKLNPKNLVYSKNRIRRKKMAQPKNDHRKRNHVYLKVFSHDSNDVSDENQVVYSTGEEDTDSQVVSVKQEVGENVILCPVVLSDGVHEYVQEYAVVDGNDEDSQCLIINSQGELETVSGHHIIYTEDGEIELCEPDDVNVNKCLVSVSQTTSEDIGKISVLNEEEVCEESVMNEVASIKGEHSIHEANKVFEIEDIQHGENSKSHFDTNLDCKDKSLMEDNIVSEYPEGSNEHCVDKIKEENGGCEDVFCLEKGSVEGYKAPPMLPIEEVTLEQHEGYEVTIDSFGEEIGVNEYVVISTCEEEENECNDMSGERSGQSGNDQSDSLVVPYETGILNRIKEEEFNELGVKEEVVVSVMVDESESVGGCEVVEPEWNEKRKKVLHKLLNVHSLIDNERQLKVFSKNISSLENVLKALSNKESVPHTTVSEQLDSNSRQQSPDCNR